MIKNVEIVKNNLIQQEPMKKHSGFIMNLKEPTRDGHIANLVITPKFSTGEADVNSKIQRNLTRDKAFSLAIELLKRGDAPSEIIESIASLISCECEQDNI